MRAAWASPATWIVGSCIAVVAAWEAHALTIPPFGGPWLAPVVGAAAWVAIFALLVCAFGWADSHSPRSAARLALRVGLALFLALLSAEAVRIGMVPLLRPLGWVLYYYLRLLLAPLLAGLWCAVLLPREVLTLWRAVRRHDVLALVVALAALLLLAAVLVSLSDLAFQLSGTGSPVQRQLARDLIGRTAWMTTTLILFAVLALVFAATSSATVAALVVVPVFAAMVFATIEKIRYIHSAVQPLDLLTLPEFMPLFASFFGAAAVVGVVVGLVLWVGAAGLAWRRARSPISPRSRVVVALGSLLLLVALVGTFLPAGRLPGPIAAHDETLRRFSLKLGGTPGAFRETARSNGIVLTFLSELRTAFVTVPPDYSAERVASTLRRYENGAAPSGATKRTGGVNLVLYLVESMMDPNELGFHYSADPMPNFRAIAAEQIHGRAIVPHQFYGSASTEFELLTGMSAAFLPTASIPYRQYVRHPLPALPRVLRDLGYTSIAVEAGPRSYYDRERVDPLLGFDRTVWPYERSDVPRADRGPWPSDDAVVSEVISASDAARPSFVFAFPAGLHSPYNHGAYAHSDLDVAGAPTSEAAAEIREYVNALRVADRAIGRLVEHFRGRRDSTIIVVLGDHLPPLSADALVSFNHRIASLSPLEREQATRAVPLLVWANFRLPQEEITLSTNVLAGYLLERMGEPASGLFAVTDSVRRALRVSSAILEDDAGHLWPPDSAPPALRPLLEDYRLIQYDLLLGKRYSLTR